MFVPVFLRQTKTARRCGLKHAAGRRKEEGRGGEGGGGSKKQGTGRKEMV